MSTPPKPPSPESARTLPAPRGPLPAKVAYVMNGFPRLSETFIANEILQLERLGLQLRLFSVKREAEAIIASEKLNIDAAKRYIASSLKREYASENGTALNEALPKLSPLNPQYRTQKQTVFQKVAAFVEKFKGVGGQI